MLGLLTLSLALGLAAAQPRSVNQLSFDGNTLFLGDSVQATVYAYKDVAASSTAFTKSPYNIPSIGCVIASLMGTTSDKIIIMDLAVHPMSKEAYIAVHKAEGNAYVPGVIIMSQCGSARVFDLNNYDDSVSFDDSIGKDFKFWGRFDGRRLTFTDMKLWKGKLYIAGLSNGDFSASMRVVDWDGSFGSKIVATAEMFHANHAQNETRAPIRAFTIDTLDDGKDYIIGAYTCTPLVLIPLDKLNNGDRVFAKTIAELGYGNTPVDLLSFTGANDKQEKVPVVFLSNKDQSSQVMYMSDINAASNEPGILSFGYYKNLGVPAKNVPMAGVLHMDDQDDDRLVGIRRTLENGKIELVSYIKNLYFRLDDFQSEFEFPDYNYPADLSPEMTFLKNTQDMLTADSGIVKEEK